MNFCKHNQLTRQTLKQKKKYGTFLSSAGYFFKFLRFGEKDNVSCVDLSSIQASLISHRIFTLLDKHDLGDGWLSHKSFRDQGERGMSFFALKQLGLGKLMLPRTAQVHWSIASDVGVQKYLSLRP